AQAESASTPFRAALGGAAHWRARGWRPTARSSSAWASSLEPVPEGTRVILRHEGFVGRPDACRRRSQGRAAKAAQQGWERVLTWLEQYAAGSRANGRESEVRGPPVECLDDAVTVALAGGALEAGEGHSLPGGEPGADSCECGALVGEPSAGVFGKERVEVGAGGEVLPLLGGYAELGQVLVADADGGAALGERTLRETLLAAEGVPADVDQERYAGALEEREVFALRAALVADGEERAGCH